MIRLPKDDEREERIDRERGKKDATCIDRGGPLVLQSGSAQTCF